jgi:translation initiation factor 2 beta subunit (eIF-2beta)/eIF-5
MILFSDNLKKYFLIKNRKYDHSHIWNAIIKDYFVRATTTPRSSTSQMSRNNMQPVMVEPATSTTLGPNFTLREDLASKSNTVREEAARDDTGTFLGTEC